MAQLTSSERWGGQFKSNINMMLVGIFPMFAFETMVAACFALMVETSERYNQALTHCFF